MDWTGGDNGTTERVKIFPQKNFALKVGLGREELQGICVMAESMAPPPPPPPDPSHPPSPPPPSSSRRREPSLTELTPADTGKLLSFTVQDFRKKFMRARDEILHKKLQKDVSSRHKQGLFPYGDPLNGDNFLAFFESQAKNGLAWREPWFLRSRVARKFDDDESVYIKVMQSLFLPLPELLEKRRVDGFKCPNPHCFLSAHGGYTDDKHDHLHDLVLHDPFGHFTVFGPGNKANVDVEKWSSDAFIHNEVMRYLGDEFKKIPGMSFIHEFKVPEKYGSQEIQS